ncbi:MAG: thiamine phosphate synthase [Prevotella sp.]|nr:thiamine phosphate synthase [Prevotella sp.]
MKLIVMTKSTFFVEEDKILTSLFDEGLDILHLHKPGSTPIYSERLLTLLDEDYRSKIIVHDHFYLKDEYRLRGIHLDDAGTPVPDGYKGRYSRTCRTLEQLKEAKRKTEYVFLENVFGGDDGTEPGGAFTAEQLKEASRRGLIDRKVYALGGIDIENAHRAKDLGFGGVVICGDLWSRFDIHNQPGYKELISHFERLRKVIN